jgi:hypothetical protein
MAQFKIIGEKSSAGRYPVTVKSESTGDTGTGWIQETDLAHRYETIRNTLKAGDSIVGLQGAGFKELDIWDLQFESPLKTLRKRLLADEDAQKDHAQGYGEVW